MIDENIQRCFNKICENFGVVAGLHITEPILNRSFHDVLTTFINISTCSYFNLDNQEILKNKIKSKKDYRKLRRLIRLKLIDSLHQIQDLVEDNLRNLGAKV